jgi:hypothetical protein
METLLEFFKKGIQKTKEDTTITELILTKIE